MPRSSRGLVAFIDLLGTKESHKVSSASFEETIESFCWALAKNSVPLNSKKYSVAHFSDCAFVSSTSDHVKLFNYLNVVRHDLLSLSLYFKCGLGYGENKLYSDEEARNKLRLRASKEFGGSEHENSKVDEFLDSISEIFSYRLFGPDSVPSYLAHEKLKGVGYYISEDVAQDFPDFCVKSVYVNDKESEPLACFHDLRFADSSVSKNIYVHTGLVSGRSTQWFDRALELHSGTREEGQSVADESEGELVNFPVFLKEYFIFVRSKKIGKHPLNKTTIVPKVHDQDNTTDELFFNRLFRAIRRSYVKNTTYPKYYLSLLVTILRSSCYDFMWYDAQFRRWEGAPHLYWILFCEGKYAILFGKYKHYDTLLMIVLSEILTSVDRRRAAIFKESSDDTIAEYTESKILPRGIEYRAYEIADYDLIMPTDNTVEYCREYLQILNDTETQSIQDFIKYMGRRLAGGLSTIPSFVLSNDHKHRIELVYADQHLT